ncbi:MAG: DUF2090 domain-containing protein [Candidatus Roizmanbacteria bacterium]|nr:MAG: DUF2090 domain-containing protein [Candidatus Roizmanbacteria bacterium]
MDLSQFTSDGKFLMLALDHRDSLKKLINPQNPGSVTLQEIIDLKSQIMDTLSDQFSGVLIDAEYGLKAYKEKTKPYLLPAEKSGYVEKEGDRVTEIEYLASELKSMGASGVKLLIYFNEDSPTAGVQLETAKKVLKDCHDNDMPLFLEIVTYGDKGPKSEQVLGAVNTFIDQEIRADVFKLEFSGDTVSCRKVTECLGNTPWILLSKGADFNLFKEQVKTAVSGGAKGFLAGRSIWQEAGQMKGEERTNFLQTVVRERFKEICAI